MTYRSALVLFIFSLFEAAGCSLVHTVPLAARAGDTIMVSIGSPDDVSADNITSITYTPTGGSPIIIPNAQIRSIFNVYPDKTSAAWLYSNAGLIENESGHGPWTTVIALNLPTDGSLPVGTGSLQVNTTANYAGIVPGINGTNMALEILPGTAPSPSSFNYRGIGGFELSSNLTELAPMRRVKFRPTFTGYDATNTYGAVAVQIRITALGAIQDNDFNVVVDDKIGYSQSRRVHNTWNRQGQNIYVYFISPTGKLQYSDIDFSIISNELQGFFEAGTDGSYTVANDVTVVSTIYYDINGAVVPGGPVINVVNETGI